MRWGIFVAGLGVCGAVFWIITLARSNTQAVAARFGEFTAFWILFGLLAVVYSGVRLWGRGHQKLVKQAKSCRGRLCVNCHYPLVDLPDQGTCPECGQRYNIDLVIMAWRIGDPSIAMTPDDADAASTTEHR